MTAVNTPEPRGDGTSTKVRLPAWVGATIAVLLALLGVAGVEVPGFLTEDYLLHLIGATVFVVSQVMRLVGYFVRERNPARSAIDVIEADEPV